MNTTITSPKSRWNDSLKYIKRDAMAGTVAGVMAVPLTIGICLMSDYPVMTGLYTVILAGIVSFVTYLFKPGNYTGMPGVAAGLAPAMAMGVGVFGLENMPFVILITAIFQALVWKFRLERYILRIVPHYLVEGLLAGVGLKIAFKFIPFLYDIQHETTDWLNFEREIVLILSVVSFALFVLLYKYYKKNMPALPYFVIMASSALLSFFLPLAQISIDSVPFEFILPLPHFEDLNTQETFFMAIKIIGFAMMLGTIDVIEQVMSNVAIEKIDPLKRKADSNNSLLAIWIANILGTFFGGMTNLDGLPKSTTNTVAGAMTKFSNLFTSFFLLIVVLNPWVITALPEYSLGIIMVYSGWKMIANIAHVRSEGRYALIMAGVCAILVFEVGIFEALIVLLVGHAFIQYVFMKRIGKSNSEILQQFFAGFQEHGDIDVLEREDMISEPSIPVLQKWIKSVNSKDLSSIMTLYDDDSVMIPAFSTVVRKNKYAIKDFYRGLFQKDDLKAEIVNVTVQTVHKLTIDSGIYRITWKTDGFETSYMVRFSFVIEGGDITAHHSSLEPSEDVSVSKPENYTSNYIA